MLKKKSLSENPKFEIIGKRDKEPAIENPNAVFQAQKH